MEGEVRTMKAWLLLLGSIPSLSLSAQTPTKAELEEKLSTAKMMWGTDVEIGIEMKNLNSCPQGPLQSARIADHQITTTETTLTFDDGHRETSITKVLLIQINTACDWGKLDLLRTITHEVGHGLIGGDWHSKNPRSVMSMNVVKGQYITAEDRERASHYYVIEARK